MSAAPPRVQLREAAEPVSRPVSPSVGETYRQLGVSLWGKGAYEREPVDGGLTKYQQLFRAERGDIVVNKIWARNGSVAVVDDSLAGCHGSNEFPMFAPIEGRLDPRWMHWVTKTKDFWAQCDQKSQGTSGQNRIKPEHFLDVEIPLLPLNEQHRVVARIEDLAAKVEEARGLRSSTLHEIAAWRSSRFRRVFESLDATSVPLEKVCSAIIDNLHSNPIYAEGGRVPCIRSSDVGFGSLDLANARRTDEAEYLRRTARGEPQVGDIVLVREGGGTGKCALVLREHRFSLGQRVMMLRPDRDKVLSKFFLYQLLSPTIQEDHVQPLSKGSASPHLNIGSLRQFPFLLPSVSEQAKIIENLDALQAKLDGIKALQTETAAELDAMVPAILDKAFKGEL
jgi:type I restriction enzyme S subunit